MPEQHRDYLDMSLADFEALPEIEWDFRRLCDSAVFLPSPRVHGDSGYRLVDFVPVVDGQVQGKVLGYDVVHLCKISDGLDGRSLGGRNILRTARWIMDCLPRSNLLHAFVQLWKNAVELHPSCGHLFPVETEEYLGMSRRKL